MPLITRSQRQEGCTFQHHVIDLRRLSLQQVMCFQSLVYTFAKNVKYNTIHNLKKAEYYVIVPKSMALPKQSSRTQKQTDIHDLFVHTNTFRLTVLLPIIFITNKKQFVYRVCTTVYKCVSRLLTSGRSKSNYSDWISDIIYD